MHPCSLLEEKYLTPRARGKGTERTGIFSSGARNADYVRRKRGVINCEDMGDLYDISVEHLMGGSSSDASLEAAVQGRKSSLSPEALLAERLRRKLQEARKRGLKMETEAGAPAASTGDSGQQAATATFYLETFGCQMNDHDSEKVAGVLLARGYTQVAKAEEASVVLYNTCSIREKAAQKVFSRLGEYRDTKKEGQVIGVLGCVAQQEGEAIFERAPWVSLVCGSASYRKLPELIAQLETGNTRVTGLDNDTEQTFETPMTRRDNPWRAYITIIEGCDKACSYCVVPFTRGPERSRTSVSVLEEARQLADLGYTEIQLLGQTVNSYADPSARKMRFSELLVAVAEIPGIRRVRFTTSHPRDFGKDIVEAMDAYPAICDHVHLPVQSGSTSVLRAMARTYTREEYLQKIAVLHGAKRSISITTDIIVGFPGETENDFEQTLSLLDAVKYDSLFAFKYSPRPNTPSLHMRDAIPEEEKSRRLSILLAKQQRMQVERNSELLGKRFEVLVEGKSRRENQWSGHTSCNRVLNFTSPERNILGHYRQIRVTSAGPNSLVGEAEFNGS
jgi:tRNA-2-methylthio-N6-dimethylallyladenosine synthase